MGQVGRWLRRHRDLLELVHGLDALRQPIGRLERLVHLDHVAVHLLEVLVDELVDDLRGQVHPDVQDAALVLSLERLDQVFLDVRDD